MQTPSRGGADTTECCTNTMHIRLNIALEGRALNMLMSALEDSDLGATPEEALESATYTALSRFLRDTCHVPFRDSEGQLNVTTAAPATEHPIVYCTACGSKWDHHLDPQPSHHTVSSPCPDCDAPMQAYDLYLASPERSQPLVDAFAAYSDECEAALDAPSGCSRRECVQCGEMLAPNQFPPASATCCDCARENDIAQERAEGDLGYRPHRGAL